MVARRAAAPRKTKPAAEAAHVRPPVREPATRRGRKHKGGQVSDQFELPPDVLADLRARGMSAEWKRETNVGQPDPAYAVRMREQGFDPVDGSRYPQMVADDHKGPIRRDGMILMERPIEDQMEAMQEDRANARAAVRGKEEQLGVAGSGEFERKDAGGRSTVQINRTVERGLPID